MSQYLDFILNTNSEMDVSSLLEDEINNMDIPLITENSEFMSSEFFDSVLSMEHNLEANIEDDFLREFKYEVSSEDGLTPPHTCSDSASIDSDNSIKEDNNITIFGSDNSETLKGDDFFSLLDPTSLLQNNINNILGIPQKKNVVSSGRKKLMVSKAVSSQNNKKAIQSPKKQQMIRVQSGNGRSLLLPYNIKNVKKFKIINASELKVENIKVLPNQPMKKPYAASTSSESVDEIDVDLENITRGQGKPGDKVKLTPEEKRLLIKEGIHIPSNFPLTKHQEKELKRIRRKIRNKISAQDSRKRKKEYVDQLEEKARRTDEENEILKKRVRFLNRENTKLYEQLKKLQDVLFSPSSKATPTTCLMIVLFSTLLVCLPNLRTAENKDLEIGDQQLVAARRALLFNQKSNNEEDNTNLEEFLVFNKEGENEMRNDEDKENGTQPNVFMRQVTEISKKYENLIRKNCSEVLKDGILQEFCSRNEADLQELLTNMRSLINDGMIVEEKKFIEPDISDDEDEIPTFTRRNGYLSDDDDPPTKKIRISSEHIEYDKNIPVKLESMVEVEMSTTVEPNTLLFKKE